MITLYRPIQRIERNQQGSTHTLAILLNILMSMLRVCLQYAYSMPRVCLGYAWSMARVCLGANILFPHWEQNIPIQGTKHSHLGNKTALRLVVSLLLFLVLGSGNVWGQTHPYAGVWYMTVKKNTAYYMVPAANPQVDSKEDAYFSSDYSTQQGDPEKPFITTYQTSGDLNSIWIFVPVSGENNFYYIVHAKTGKYVKYQQYLSGGNARRKFVHLETMVTPGETEKFEITALDVGVKIKPKSNTMYFNVAGDNQPRYNGGPSSPYYSGMVGGMTGTDDNSQFNLIDASTSTDLTPVISDVNELNNTFTITSPAVAFSTIHYTTDGSTTPDASTGTAITSGSSIDFTGNCTVKAVGVFGSLTTPVATKTVTLAPCATPVISYNDATSKVSISCTTSSCTIYYTTDGSTPNTLSTAYSGPFSVDGPTTVKAIATHTNLPSSTVAELAITQVATPTIQNNGSNAISITSATPGATIFYTTDGSTPTTSSTRYITPLTDNVSNVTIKAIAVKANMIPSAVGSGSVKLQCATPVITRDGMTFTLLCNMPTDAKLYYTIGDGAETLYSGAVDFSGVPLPTTVTAVARHSNYTESDEASMELKTGSGTPEDPYLIYGSTDFTNFITNVNNGTTASASYKLGSDVSASGTNAITTEFTGTFDGDCYTISGLSHPLFNTVNGGVVKNVMLKNVHINQSGNVGAITGEAKGYTRIYNCGILPNDNTFSNRVRHSSVASTDAYCGGLVGWLKDDSRVINCFSFANVNGGTVVAGIVGYNNFASTAKVTAGKYTELKTAIVNCMFYGNITNGTTRYPVYGGKKIQNKAATGINNYDFYRAEANLGLADNSHYNCSWPAKEEYLTKYEYYRYLLNSNRELCGWWVGAPSAPSEMSTTDVQAVPKDASLMAKWVLDPSIAPYPILKAPGKYYSAINQDPDKRINPVSKTWESRSTSSNTITTKAAPDTEGQKLGSITVIRKYHRHHQ